jgi:hypothetical protein
MVDSVLGSIKNEQNMCLKPEDSIQTTLSNLNQNLSGEIDANSLKEMMNIGPNVNLKFGNYRKESYTPIEKEIFKNKIKTIKKTELCKNWGLYGNCYFKDNCSFAHGENELRRKSKSLNLKYKTKKCVVFKRSMYCPFGNRCQYSHILPHSKLLSYKYKLNYFVSYVFKEVCLLDEVELINLIANRKFQRYQIFLKIYSARLKIFKKILRERNKKTLDK